MMPGAESQFLGRDKLKPQMAGETLWRFSHYFTRYWMALPLLIGFMLLSVWLNISWAEIPGQAVDCYLFSTPESKCTYTAYDTYQIDRDDRLNDLTRRQVKAEGLLLMSRDFILFLIGATIFTGLTSYTMTWVGQHALRDLRVDLFRHVQQLSLDFYTSNATGDLMSRFVNDAETIQQILGFALAQVLTGILLIGWIVIRMLQTNWQYAFLSLLMLPIIVVTTAYFSAKARLAFRQSRLEMGNLNTELQERMTSIRETQAFNRERRNMDSFYRKNGANRDANIHAAKFTNALSPMLEAAGYVAIILVVVVGGWSALHERALFGTTAISLGTIFTFLIYTQRFNQPVRQIATMWVNIQSAIAGAERIFQLMDTQSSIPEDPSLPAMPTIRGKVEFIGVSAGYGSQPVLKYLDFCAEPGQKIAIVGATGAGKTTLINLIPRFYDVTGGVIQIDGINIRQVNIASLRSQIGIVVQDTFLFSDTVLNNIRYGRLDATDAEVIAAAELACVDQIVKYMPHGYQTLLGERGSGLSQGQRQLIAIARAVLSNPRILILDEATSNVDTLTEYAFQNALGRLLENRTCFVVAHRLSTIQSSDQILMIDKGQIIERGTHDELLNKQEHYHRLYMKQFANS
jgi:ATP-binding cassette subfamily B multidrug efflux pump